MATSPGAWVRARSGRCSAAAAGWRRRIRPRAARLALGVTLSLWAAGPAPAVEVPPAATPMEIQGLTYTGSREGRLEVLLRADRAVLDPDTRVAHLEQVEVRVNQASGRPGFELRCREGELDLDSQDFVASGNVQGRTADGRRFASAWLRYDHARGVAWTDAPVRIREAGRTLRGGGLRYEVREGRLRLLGGAVVEQGP